MNFTEIVLAGVAVAGAALWRWRGPIGRVLLGGRSTEPARDTLDDLIRLMWDDIQKSKFDEVKEELRQSLRERLEPVTKAGVIRVSPVTPENPPSAAGPAGTPK